MKTMLGYHHDLEVEDGDENCNAPVFARVCIGQKRLHSVREGRSVDRSEDGYELDKEAIINRACSAISFIVEKLLLNVAHYSRPRTLYTDSPPDSDYLGYEDHLFDAVMAVKNRKSLLRFVPSSAWDMSSFSDDALKIIDSVKLGNDMYIRFMSAIDRGIEEILADDRDYAYANDKGRFCGYSNEFKSAISDLSIERKGDR
ncbi:hypothetical protein KJ632_04075, partial [Patescibacteria group bacterium]|nr:hypothetical protein [Patescibacteria group bacterium]